MTAQVWKGNPRLEPLLVAIDSIETHPRNPRRGDLPLLAESLDAFGQTRPIVVQPDTGYICAGNHTYRAALEVLGWTHIAVVKPVLEPDEYDRYLLMDNRASDQSEYDEEQMAEILRDLVDRQDLAHTGWDSSQAEDFIADTQMAARGAEAEFQGGYAEGDADSPERERSELFQQPKAQQSQLMLAYNRDDYQELVRTLGSLRREYKTEGPSDTIERAIAEQFSLVWSEPT